MSHGSTSPTVGALSTEVLGRDDWGAEPPIDWPAQEFRVRALVVHHTATRNEEADPLGMLRRVQRFHAHERGWGDIGYSFIVLEDGRIVEGRAGSMDVRAPLGVVAGHAYGHNRGTIGVAVAGRFHRCAPTAPAWDALVDLTTAICRSCDLDPAGGPVTLANGRTLPHVISGHRHAQATTCPGDWLADRLGALRMAAADRLLAPPPSRAGAPSG